MSDGQDFSSVYCFVFSKIAIIEIGFITRKKKKHKILKHRNLVSQGEKQKQKENAEKQGRSVCNLENKE